MTSNHLAKSLVLVLGITVVACGGGGSGSGDPSTYTLAVTKSGGGTGTVTGGGIQCGTTCSVSLAAGKTVTLSAVADTGLVFGGWGGACSGTSPECAVSMTSDTTVTATFWPSTFSVAATVAGAGTGTVTGAGLQCGTTCSVSATAGKAVTVTAVAATGSTFAGWSGACSGAATKCVLKMTADKAVTATFDSLGNGLIVTRAGTGSGSVASTPPVIDCGFVCQVWHQSGTVTLTATPAAGATFAGWTGACEGTAPCVLSMTSTQAVTATFTAGTDYASPSAGCNNPPSSTLSSMMNTGNPIAITAAGLQRRYILSVPTTYDNTHPYRLVIAFHEYNGNDKKMYANGYYHLQNPSGESTIFVAPNGQYFDSSKGTASKVPCTGTGVGEGNCGWPNPDGTDLALADAVVADVAANFCIDMNRIFVTGWSYGGSMSYETACERPAGGTGSWSVRGAAIYSGSQLSGTCTPSKPVAYYQSHGVSDSVLPYDNGLQIFQKAAANNGCQYVTPTKVTSGNHVCTVLAGCATGFPTAFCSFNGDHTPDPLDGVSSTSWQYQTVWDFFSQL